MANNTEKIDIYKSTNNPIAVASVLAEFNRWRRGEGPYEWHNEPALNKRLPYTSAEIGVAIEAAVRILQETDA